jgi:hypothetical protein
MHKQTMAQSRPSRIHRPSAKLGPENVGSHQISYHRHAVADACKAQAAKKPSDKSPASHDVDASIDHVPVTGGNVSDPELGTTPDIGTIPKKRPIVLSDNSHSDDLSSAQPSDGAPPKKKKKTKKHSSTGT